jgi:CRP/FNR family transcriptional regulator
LVGHRRRELDRSSHGPTFAVSSDHPPARLATRSTERRAQLRAELAALLSSAQEQMLLLGRKTAQEKIASFLLMMVGREGQGDRVTLPMTRADIGDYLGLTTETVSRTLTQLKTEGIIAVVGSAQVTIADRDRPESRAHGL